MEFLIFPKVVSGRDQDMYLALLVIPGMVIALNGPLCCAQAPINNG